MNKIMKDRFLLDLIGLGERIRDLCAARFPKNIAHYTGSQLRMIKRIFELTRSQREGIQLKTLAKVLAITPAATSERVETLVQRGALERRVDAHDRRAMSLRLVPELEAHFFKSEEYIASLMEELLSGYDPESRRIAAEIVARLNGHLTEICQQQKEEDIQ